MRVLELSLCCLSVLGISKSERVECLSMKLSSRQDLNDIKALTFYREGEVSEGHNFSNVLSPNNSLCIANTSCMSPAQIDPFFTQGEALKNSDQLDESWVTVFGFPAASSPYILQQFSQYGNIVEHKLSPNGNWMHVRYQSKLQAKKALSKNGKVFSGNIMIGVKPCIEMDLMESFRDDFIQESTLTKGQDSFRAAETSFEPTRPSLKNIRPLTQAYQSPSSQSPVTVAKSGNIVSKAFEYLWKLH
ncbi:hypothetical protein JTE90_003225 [Oedothorax gibbosus]|uniref:Nucleoporin NUP35 n=1 Tax=Oedothorax gibbosus TaxID=931172 RepID=A0AAV6UQX7_9ARAC|nr:hypothetical protein JTE90_003225 [Oedothorax gibbosus]